MNWLYNGAPFEEISDPKLHGFVYRITCKVNGFQYIGKKSFWAIKYKQVKKKKKRLKVESNWKDYFGSSEELAADCIKYGLENFDREILVLNYSKGDNSYHEARYQLMEDVLRKNYYYNSWVQCKIHRKHLKK